jgi:hypothetical protein
MLSNTNPATMCSNGDGGNELFVTSGGAGYIWDYVGLTLTRIAFTSGATDWLPADFGGYMDGFFLALDASASQFYISESLDGATWDVTQVEARSVQADRWRSLLVVRGEAWLFGNQSTDVYRNTGASPFPFTLIGGTAINVGILAPYSACVWNNTAAWLGSSASGGIGVFVAEGYQPKRISTTALDQRLSQYAVVSDARGYAESYDGHDFYVLTFPTEGHTWVFDAQTGQWHERGWMDPDTGAYQAARPVNHAYAFGKHLVGDRASGVIWQIDPDTHTDADGVPLVWLRQCPHLNSEGTTLFHHRLWVDAETGLGALTGQGLAPQAMLRWSDDNAHTWGNVHLSSLGKRGEYAHRMFWTRLGRARDRVYQVSGSDPVPVRLVDASLDIEKGTA